MPAAVSSVGTSASGRPAAGRRQHPQPFQDEVGPLGGEQVAETPHRRAAHVGPWVGGGWLRRRRGAGVGRLLASPPGPGRRRRGGQQADRVAGAGVLRRSAGRVRAVLRRRSDQGGQHRRRGRQRGPAGADHGRVHERGPVFPAHSASRSALGTLLGTAFPRRKNRSSVQAAPRASGSLRTRPPVQEAPRPSGSLRTRSSVQAAPRPSGSLRTRSSVQDAATPWRLARGSSVLCIAERGDLFGSLM